MRKLVVLFVVALFMCLVPVYGATKSFQLYDVSSGEYVLVSYADTLKQANATYDNLVDSYDNLVIMSDDKILRMEKGIVTFLSDSACSINTEFKNAASNGDNYLNGCFGFDGAYISGDGVNVVFMIAGVKGYVNVNKLILIPYELIDHPVTSYRVKNHRLFHQIKTEFYDDLYSNYIDLNSAPGYLKDNSVYFSYDGHYFYDDLGVMLDDYRWNSRESAVNSEPYYNYYQFVSHRSFTNISLEEIEDYFYNKMNLNSEMTYYIDKNKDSTSDVISSSQFYHHLDAFYHYQYAQGSNAMMMLSLATNESGYGRSSLAFGRNNLFGHAAYDSSVEKSASRYNSVNNSVYSHANSYISGSYCYPGSFTYHGGFFGNKSNGMNVSYASDPYWSEKAASNYGKFDEAFGYKDLNAVTLGIVTEDKKVNVYLYADNQKVLYSTNGERDFSFVIIDQFANEEGNWYVVQSDPIIENEEIAKSGIYDFANMIAYIHQEDIGYVLKGKGNRDTIVDVTFDAGEGVFRDGSSAITIPYKLNDMVTYEAPVYPNHEFIRWENALDRFKAVYKEVSSIELLNEPFTEYEIYDRIYLKGLNLKVNYADGSKKEIPVTTGMVSGFNFNEVGEQEVIVSYGGCSITYPITVSQELDDIRQNNKAAINDLLSVYEGVNEFSDDDLATIKEVHQQVKTSIFPTVTVSQLRRLDELTELNSERTYVINDNQYDLSVSGLSLNVLEESDLDFADQLKLVIKHVATDEKVRTMVEGFGYRYADGFRIDFYHNFKKKDIDGDMIYSIMLPEYPDATEYQVWKIDGNDVIQLDCKQTQHQIHFRSEGTGTYVLLAKESFRTFDELDYYENIDKSDCGVDELQRRNRAILLLAIAAVALSLCIILILLDRMKRRRHDSKVSSVRRHKVSKKRLS